MMMQKGLLLVIVFAAIVFIAGCSDEEETIKSIEGVWVRAHAVTNVAVRLTFFDDGTFLFEPVVQTDQHSPSTGRYTFSGSELTIFDDNDCPGIEGKYAVVVKSDTIEVETKEDDCTPRGIAMGGRWMRE